MKNTFTVIADSVEIALLVPSLLWCLISSFGLSANVGLLYILSALFTAAVTSVCVLIKSKKAFAVTVGLTFLSFAICILTFITRLTGQLEYILNTVFDFYSQYIDLPKDLSLGGSFEVNASLFFIFAEFFLALIFTLFVIRFRLLVPVTALSIILLVPCFIMVNTVPNLFALFTTIAILLTFFVTSNLHRHSNVQSGAISAISFVLIFSLLLGVYVFNPMDGYERAEWQDDFLIYAEELTGLSSGDGNSELVQRKQKLKNSLEKEQDLSNAGPLEQTGELVMQIYADYGEDTQIYLRGTAYANFENNKWKILDDVQARAYPKNFNAFNINNLHGLPMDFKIKTAQISNIVYTPYYMTYTPVYVQPLADIYIPNDSGRQSYTLSYIPYIQEMEVIEETEEYKQYCDFVYDNYLQISDSLKNQLIKIGEQNGIERLPIDSRNAAAAETATRKQLANDIKNLVSNSAAYSLNSTGAPKGEEIPVWLLTEAESAYCVHFATTAAMMLRAYGIPARYVTGYYASRYYDYETPDEENKIDVTTDNAHAWVEYFTDEYGWIPLEATPSDFQPAVSAIDFPEIDAENAQGATSHYTTQPTDSEPTTQPQTAPKQNKTQSGTDNLKKAVIALCALILLLIALIIRMKAVTSLRKKRFGTGRKNERAVYFYRYIRLCRRCLKTPLPEEIEALAAKAKFSNHIISDEELKFLTDEADNSKSEIYKNCNFFKKLFYKVILVI